MAAAIGSLSSRGWITDSSVMLSYIISYYILSDSAQSLVFQGNIINLPDTYHNYINDPIGMATGVRTDLERLLSRYYPVVDIETEAKSLSGNKYGILIYASVVDASNTKIELSRVVQVSTTGLREIIDMNNYGDASSCLSSLI